LHAVSIKQHVEDSVASHLDVAVVLLACVTCGKVLG